MVVRGPPEVILSRYMGGSGIDGVWTYYLYILYCPVGWAIHQLSAVSYLYTVYIAIVFSLVPVLVFTENAQYLSYSLMPLCFQTFKSVNLC